MTEMTIGNATELVREIASISEPEQTEYIKMMRHVLMGLRLTERTLIAQSQAERESA